MLLTEVLNSISHWIGFKNTNSLKYKKKDILIFKYLKQNYVIMRGYRSTHPYPLRRSRCYEDTIQGKFKTR